MISKAFFSPSRISSQMLMVLHAPLPSSHVLRAANAALCSRESENNRCAGEATSWATLNEWFDLMWNDMENWNDWFSKHSEGWSC